ncbi:peroxisomal membrane protein [Diplodia corticola]|uniref:Peroxisomal membrane protein n=1 Tax=Diplodia corticola TaxID=236234 RepID=A0A1J9QWS7_9PEZI|nr:peroxisomal membrane protein [Diplodia corticola]OJD32872.1 peroxisomal membrane protein [Diplodia corticola]
MDRAMELVKSMEASAERIALDPKYHDALTLVKGIRNGIVYGSKVRFPHALVLRTKAKLVFKATRQHARNLGMFALVYKTGMLLLRRMSPTGKEQHYDAFLAGLAGGYAVFGRTINSSVSQQIVIYVFARVVLAYAKLMVQPKAGDHHHKTGAHHGHNHGHNHGHGHHGRSGGGWEIISDPVLAAKVRDNGWTVFASVSWALVMYLFRWHPETLQSSLRSSMHYIYEQSDHWDSLRTLIWHNK